MDPDFSLPTLTRRQQYVVVAIVAAVLGVALVPAVLGAVDDSQDGTVAVVEFEGPVVTSTAEEVEAELRDVRRDGSIDAVVLKIDTTGGSPAASEQLYTSVQRTAAEMPVMVSVQEISASGGYYAMAPADEIYILPTSITGSIGVAGPAPTSEPPVEGPTGPDKRGSNEIQTWATRQLLDDVFLDTVMEQRGDEIELSREEVATAATYLGVEAVDNGLADGIGDTDTAIEAAADAAGLESYDVVIREAPSTGGIILLETDDGFAVVHEGDPGYNDVEFLNQAYVHAEAVPHVDDVDRFVSADVTTANTTAVDGGERP